MKFCLFLLLLQSTAVFAEKKMVEKDLSLLGKIDEGNIKKQEATKVLPMPTMNDSKFSVTCKDSLGNEFKKSDAGYEVCMAGIKTQHDMNKLNSGLDKKNSKDGNSASFNYKIGD